MDDKVMVNGLHVDYSLMEVEKGEIKEIIEEIEKAEEEYDVNIIVSSIKEGQIITMKSIHLEKK